MAKLATKGKSTIVWILMGMLILGLGGFGVTNFGGSQGDLGRVGETTISVEDYARTLQNQLNNFSAQTGQAFTMEQAQSIGLPQQVQAELFTSATLAENARKIGLSVGDQRVADVILSAGAFRGPNGKFDRVAYGETLRRQGMTEAEFEAEIRADEARLILQRAVAEGAPAPAAMVDQTVQWLLEGRDITWRELTAADLSQPVMRPEDEQLQAWHKANADRFTMPELRKITYVWLTPEMLEDEVELDEAALRAEYDRRLAEFQRPERRLVGRLVFPDMAAAEDARARLDAGDLGFAELVAERGLTVDDIELGEVTEGDLGAEAGAAVFALDEPGVVGPFQTTLGPALFSMNGVLEPVDVSFEDAQDELRGEAALDRAARMVEDRAGSFEDLLASGATLEDVAAETEMQLGQINFDAASAPQHTGIDGYQAFRERAGEVSQDDFPQLYQLDDGGVFALRLDEIVPPALKPFEEVADEVADDWIASETHGRLMARAKELAIDAAAEQPLTDEAAEGAAEVAAPVLPESETVTALTRDGWIDGVPQQVITSAFSIAEPGATEAVSAQDRVFLVTLDAIEKPDLTSEAATEAKTSVSARLGQSVQNDLFEYYVRAVQTEAGIQLNPAALATAESMVR